MSILINADEVFGIGLAIESNGRAFYLTAAAVTQNAAAKALFVKLADWELVHVKLFENLRAHLPVNASTDKAYDPYDEQALYIKAAGDNHVFVKNKDAEALARGCKTPVEALQLAMTFEKDSVVYYSAIQRVMAETQGAAEISKIIDEELSHIAFLDREIRALS